MHERGAHTLSDTDRAFAGKDNVVTMRAEGAACRAGLHTTHTAVGQLRSVADLT